MNTRILLPIFALIVALGIFFIYVNPTWTSSIPATQAGITADDQALSSAQQYAAQQNQLAASRDAIDPANITALSIFLPDSVNNVGLILDLNALAARSGLSVANIDVISTVDTTKSNNPSGGTQNPVNSVDLSLSAAGTFSALQSFLSGAEKSARLLDVRDLSVRGSDTGVYNYQMTIRLYWLR